MTSHETRTYTTTRNKSAASDQNDLKKLKSKHSAKLPTLKVLFSDWSDEDLLFVLEEANGDLDITIDRISEGHANQWGEVKTKKSKKEAQKAKAATSTVSTNQQQSTITPYREPPQQQQRSHNPRPGKVTSNTPRTRTQKSHQPVSWDKPSTSSSSYHDVPSGSWASIAKHNSETTNNLDDGWNTSNDTATNATSAVDEWGPSLTSTNTSNDTANDEDQPKTWASLLKSKPKLESEESTTEDVNETNEWDAPASTNVNISSTDEWDAKPVADEWSTPVHESTPVTTTQTEQPQESSWETNEKEPAWATTEQEPSWNTSTNEQKSSWDEPIETEAKKEEPESLEAKFSSLNVEEEKPVEEIVKETVTEVTIEETVVAQVNATTTPPTSAAAPVTNDTFSQPYLKQQEQTFVAPQQPQAQVQQQQPQVQAQVPQQPQVPQQQQAVPQQQQQQLGMDHLTSAYSSYLPNQPPAGVSGFGMNPMGDYGIYSTEAQRAAAMGYYDPTAFSHSPSVTSASTYQARDKYTQDLTGQNQNIAQQQQQQQQVYPPYYQYYYMPNQFNAYQQSTYGQFMNKNMYPNMYQQQQQQQQQQPGKPATSAASPYGNTASPYGQQSQLYNHQYDDLLNDYQKSMYGGQGGFLGNLNGGQQQQPQQGQKSERTPQQTQQAQQTQPQQQQPQQAYANYFGQPQMFSYGQYPQQYQQQMPQQRQQQYWNQ